MSLLLIARTASTVGIVRTAAVMKMARFPNMWLTPAIRSARNYIAGGVEGLVLPKLAIEESHADHTHRDCSQGRPKKWTRSSNQDLRRIHRPWSGSDTEQNRSQS